MPRSGGKKKWKSSNKPDHAYNPKQDTTGTKPVSEYAQSVQAEVQALFKKRYSFRRPHEGQVWTLPLAASLFSAPAVKDWDPVMNKHKAELNDLKCELSDKDIREWHQHTSFTHRSALVIPHLRHNYWTELCTQAWCKFYEIVSSYDIIQPGLLLEAGTPFNSVHLCEAPGAFVTSLNHFIKSHGRLKKLSWKWLATTLNPYYEGNSTDIMIADDRFILQTQGNWFFGEHNTGDLMNQANLMSLKQRVESTMGTVQLVTADGSINCQNDPAEQEIVVSQLHYCEVVTAMKLLATGGSFILKMFTLFEHQTACLMYLLNCTFQQVHVCKPATSKAGNSEVYIACLGFTGCQNLQDYMPSLLRHIGGKECPQALFGVLDIPPSFLDQLRSCCTYFKDCQMAAISENIWLYPHMSEQERHRLTQVRECCRQAFVERYAISSIRKADKICSDGSKGRHIQDSSGMFAKTASKRLHGTFTERQQLDHGPWLQRLNGDYHALSPTTLGSEVITQTMKNNCELMPGTLGTWELTIGKRLTSVRSSSFCVAEVLDDWNLAVTHSEARYKEENYKQASSCDQAVVGLMLADLTKLHKISRSQSVRINCMCLLWGSQDDDSFLQLVKSTGRFELRECPMQPNAANMTETEKERVSTPHDRNYESSTVASQFSNAHLTDSTIIARCCETLHDSKVPVVYSDCSLARVISSHHSRPCLSELDTRLEFLISVLIALHALHIGGTLIVRIPGLLTRFSAGLLYMIHKVFQQVTLMTTADESGPRSICIMAQEFNGVHQALIKHLQNVHTCVLETQSTKEMELLQFVPQLNLCEKDFNCALSSFNDKFLMAQTSSHVHSEQILHLDREQLASCLASCQGQTR